MELHCNDTKRRRKERPGLKQLLGALAAASLIAIPGIASAEGGSHYGMNKHQAMNVSHNWGEFKTPTLRNVAATAPYMHQGQLATLEEVVEHYGHFYRTEAAAYDKAVTDWERARYFERI